MEAQQAALEPILKASSSSSSSSSSLSSHSLQRVGDFMGSPLAATLPPYNPLALSLKKAPSSPSPVLDFSSGVKRENRGVDSPADGGTVMARLGRGSEGTFPRSGSGGGGVGGGGGSGGGGGAGHWREQWWSNMHADPRRAVSLQTSEDGHHAQEDSKEVRRPADAG